jgi:hypothetical protein
LFAHASYILAFRLETIQFLSNLSPSYQACLSEALLVMSDLQKEQYAITIVSRCNEMSGHTHIAPAGRTKCSRGCSHRGEKGARDKRTIVDNAVVSVHIFVESTSSTNCHSSTCISLVVSPRAAQTFLHCNARALKCETRALAYGHVSPVDRIDTCAFWYRDGSCHNTAA